MGNYAKIGRARDQLLVFLTACTAPGEAGPLSRTVPGNGDEPLKASKREAAGLARRRDLLRRAGLPSALVDSRPPPGVGAIDHVDAMAGLVVARDILAKTASPIPDAPERDAYGLPIVIWAPERPALG